jgi:hypothetical protein
MNGTLTLKLAKAAIVDAITLEHIHMDRALDIRSAPADFNIYGFTAAEIKHRSNQVTYGSESR